VVIVVVSRYKGATQKSSGFELRGDSISGVLDMAVFTTILIMYIKTAV